MDLSVLFNVTYGLYAVTTKEDDRAVGCIINTCSQVTSESKIFSICLNKNNYTHDAILKSKRFAISIISENTDPKVISELGFFSSREKDKFEQIAYKWEQDLPVITDNTCGAMLFEVVDTKEMDTHTVIFGKLVEAIKLSENPAMTYDYYHKVVKGKAPKNAPTYQEEVKKEDNNEVKYVCGICGYEYKGDINKEDDSFRCPICGVTKDNFKLA